MSVSPPAERPEVRPESEYAKTMVDDIHTAFNAPNRKEDERYLRIAIEKYWEAAPVLDRWMEEIILLGMSFFERPAPQRRMLWTTNLLERQIEEIKQRTLVTMFFPKNTRLCGLSVQF